MLSVFKKWAARIQGGTVDWDELEATLIQSDLGLTLSGKIITRLKGEALNAETIREAAISAIGELWPAVIRTPQPRHGQPEVWLIVGVNGAGKTTTLAKLAHRYQQAGLRVHMVGADTFRAAAVEQLKIWADRLGCGFSGGRENGDPAAAAYEGLVAAEAARADLILIDTAGRLHNKENLLRELEKVKRVIGKKFPGAPHEILLVLDGTNGGNALDQARQFHSFLEITGLIATKLDSSSKGGALAAIKAETGLDPLFLGLGEGLEDLKPFDPKNYIERFF